MTKDLMHSAEVKQVVREAYSDIDRTTEAVAEKLYSREELTQLPRSAIERSLGVANHMRFAQIEPGDTVLDIGCGGGIDSFLAAARTGEDGRVIALDFLPEMLKRTASGAAEAGFDNVETLESEMEAIELPGDSVDAIVSNGVINLSPRKARVMAECARVLRPGGTLCVSDLTVVRTSFRPRSPPSPPPGRVASPAHWRRRTSSSSSSGPASRASRCCIGNRSGSMTAPCTPSSPTM